MAENHFKKLAQDYARRARRASLELLSSKTTSFNDALNYLAKLLVDQQYIIIEANAKDLKNAKENNLSSALVDRLTLSSERIQALSRSVLDIATLSSPLGEVSSSTVRPNGMRVLQERVPIGVLCVIFESRPNVVIDIASLCLKSGNASILRGGKEAWHSNQILGSIVQKALAQAGLPAEAVQVLSEQDRALVPEILKQKDFIDIVVPRGGEGLINFVSENSLIPVIKHDKGICHAYVDKSADLSMAKDIVFNAKAQRPGVCNAIENCVIHKDFPYTTELLAHLDQGGIELRLDKTLATSYGEYKNATEEDFDTEYLDLILSVAEVNSLEDAIHFIHQHNSGHSEVIITENYNAAELFQKQVDSACTLVNASTRFNDGGELGLGAEVGISTQKLHVRGPMGLKDLTCLKYKVYGQGQIRQ